MVDMFNQSQLTVQNAMKEDKLIIDRSQDAFVSFLRYYKEH